MSSDEFSDDLKGYGKAILNFEEKLKELYSSIQSFLKGMIAYQSRMYNRASDYDKPEDLEDTEIAYHASINAK